MQAAEKRVADIAEIIATLDKALADPTLYTRDPDGASKLAMTRGQHAQALATAEENWLVASEAYEAATARAEA